MERMFDQEETGILLELRIDVYERLKDLKKLKESMPSDGRLDIAQKRFAVPCRMWTV